MARGTIPRFQEFVKNNPGRAYIRGVNAKMLDYLAKEIEKLKKRKK